MPWECRESMTGEPADRQNSLVLYSFAQFVAGSNAMVLLDIGSCHCPVNTFFTVVADRYRGNGHAILH